MSERFEIENKVLSKEELVAIVKQITNKQLKEALLEIRWINQGKKNSSKEHYKKDNEYFLLLEGVISNELKKRELFEWALSGETKGERKTQKE